MKVTINETVIQLHDGAKVEDAIRKYYALKNQKLPKPLPQVKDKYGNIVGEDGSLSENSVLYIAVDVKKETFLKKIISKFCNKKK